MAKITIVKSDNTVVVDGYGKSSVDMSGLPSNLWAVEFDSTANTGHIEYDDGTANETITSLTSAMDEVVKVNTDAKTAEDAELAAIKASYKFKREQEYPAIGDQLDNLYHAGAFDDTMTAAIKAVKDKYPK